METYIDKIHKLRIHDFCV